MRQYFSALKKAPRKQKIKCIFWFFLAVLFYLFVICMFSAQNGEESGFLSHEIAEALAGFICSIRSDNSLSDLLTLTGYFEHPVRKLAHFTEYGILGSFFAGSFLPIIKRIREGNGGSSCRLYRKCILIVFVLAAADEFHQYFVPDRYASIWDVLLDTLGSVIYVYILYLIFDRKNKKQRSKKRK